MTTTLKLDDSVGTWVKEYPATSRVFERLQIDYCCGGSQPLEEACWHQELDAPSVFAELIDVASQTADRDADDFASQSLTAMCDAIVATHHEYLRRELPRLAGLVDKVRSVHGAHYGWLGQVAESFQRLQEELVPHMFKEEQILFPAIRTIEQTGALPSFPFGSLENPIRMMEHEHNVAGQALREIRKATSDFAVPDDACNTFRAMLDGLRELEADLHLHIHKENNILFPRATQLAAELADASTGAHVAP